MKFILIEETFNPSHLDDVIKRMIALGSPTIRAIRKDKNTWLCVEGTHRVLAAKRLEIPIIIQDISHQKTVTIDLVTGKPGPMKTKVSVDWLRSIITGDFNLIVETDNWLVKVPKKMRRFE